MNASTQLQEAIEQVHKHLPGHHDQKDHGREMFHGTTAAVAKSILKFGLLVSKTKKDRTPGKKGVYTTDKLDAAIEYGKMRASQSGKSEYGIIVLRGEPDDFNSEWGFGRFAKDVSPDRITRIEIRRSSDDSVLQVLKADAFGDYYVSFITDGDDVEYIDGPEVKHLPGYHNQQAHGGHDLIGMRQEELTTLHTSHVEAALVAQNAVSAAHVKLAAAWKRMGGVTGPLSLKTAKEELAEAEAGLRTAEEYYKQMRRELADIPVYVKHQPEETLLSLNSKLLTETDQDVLQQLQQRFAEKALVIHQEKHLAGRHDQKTHGGDSIGNVADPEGTGTPGGFHSDIIVREDSAEVWERIGLRRPTDDELLNAYVLDIKDANGNPVPTKITVRTDILTSGSLGIEITGLAGSPEMLAGEVGSAGAPAFKRYITLNKDGESMAYHAEFTLPEEMQNKGIGMDMLERSEEFYEAIGVKEIRLHANSTVGRYAWPRAGFDWTEQIRPAEVDRFYAWLQDKGFSTDDVPRSINHPWEIAAWKFGHDWSPAQVTGKDYLLKSAESFDVVKRLDPNDMGYRIGKEYFKMRRSIRESLGYKSLVEKYGLKGAEDKLAAFANDQPRTVIDQAGQVVEEVSTEMRYLTDTVERQGALVKELLGKAQTQPQQLPQVINNNLLIDLKPLAEAFRQMQAPVEQSMTERSPSNVEVLLAAVLEQNELMRNLIDKVGNAPAPIVEVHPTIEMPKVKTETSTVSVLRDADKKMTGAVTIHRTEYEETKDDSEQPQ